VELSELPLTVNGKVDRRALPEPEEWGSGVGEYVGPRTATEEIVAGIWASVLKVERVGVTENFFEIGGHSLLATQVMSRLRESFGVELALRELFEHATVAGLAARVDEALHSGAGVLAPPIVAVDHNKPLPLSFAQQRLWFFDQLEPESTFYNIPTAVRLSGALNPEALGRSLSEIVRRHEVLRTVFANVEGEPVQVIRPAEPVAIDEVDLNGLAKEEREARAEELATLETQIPFDLSSGPLLRVKLLKLDVEDHVLLLTIHHIVFDGWSNGVFTAELMALYEAYSGGVESPLEDLPIQYADYAVWQRSWLQGETLQKQIEYWRKQLEGAPAALNLPLDRPRPATPTHRGATTPVSLSPEHSDMLRTLSQRNGVTLFMTLVTALNVLLRHHSGAEDILMGSNVANRNHSNTEKLIGFFINQVVLRFDLSGDPTFQELLTRVRDVMLGAYAHQDLPFEKLVEELQPARSAGHSLLFQVKVDMYAPTSAQRQTTGPRISVLEPRHNIARYDLQMSFLDTRPSLQGSLIYSTDIFEAATMAHYAKQLQSILTTVTERTEIGLNELDEILTKSDEQEALEREQRVEEASLRKLKAIGQRRSS
jgi:acyl carrier protein